MYQNNVGRVDSEIETVREIPIFFKIFEIFVIFDNVPSTRAWDSSWLTSLSRSDFSIPESFTLEWLMVSLLPICLVQKILCIWSNIEMIHSKIKRFDSNRKRIKARYQFEGLIGSLTPWKVLAGIFQRFSVTFSDIFQYLNFFSKGFIIFERVKYNRNYVFPDYPSSSYGSVFEIRYFMWGFYHCDTKTNLSLNWSNSPSPTSPSSIH